MERRFIANRTGPLQNTEITDAANKTNRSGLFLYEVGSLNSVPDMEQERFTKNILCVFLLTITTGLCATAADDTAPRVANATAAFKTIMESGHGIPAGKLAGADCIVVIPGFKKGAAVVGVGFGRGFISCRTASDWSVPGAVTLESASLGIQIGGEKIDIVILSLDKERRAKLLSDRFTMGSDASAAWENRKSAHEDPNAKILFFGHTKGVFAGFGLDGATLKPDESAIKALYEKSSTNSDIVEGGTETPEVAKPLIANLPR
jgi:lipid-binding SYLF domain-containing protein